MRKWTRAVTIGLGLAISIACSAPKYFKVESVDGAAIAAADEDVRMAVIGKRTTRNDAGVVTERTVTCIEPVGPAMRLQNVQLNGNIDAAGSSHFQIAANASGRTNDGGTRGDAGLGVDSDEATHIQGGVSADISQSLAQIYQVGEIMQFVQEMSFRYCELYANGGFDEASYIKAIRDLTSDARSLLSMQMGLQAGASFADVIAAEADWRRKANVLREPCQQYVGNADPTACTSSTAFATYIAKHPSVTATPNVRVVTPPVPKNPDVDSISANLRAAESADKTADGLTKNASRLVELMHSVAPNFTADGGTP